MDLQSIYNFDAEINVLGSILVENDSICEVIVFLESEDFYKGAHKLIYKNLKEMYEANISMDIVTLSERLKDKLTDIGGISYLSNIINSNVTTRNVKKYGEIIKEKANFRKLVKVFNDFIDRLKSGEFTPEKLIDHVEDSLLKIKSSESRDAENMGMLLQSFIDTLQERYERGGDIQGIKSGYKAIDRILGGFSREDLVILAARPAMGKTAMALNILINTGFKEKAKAAFFNLEMGVNQMLDRTISAYSSIPLDNIKNARLTEKQWCSIVDAASGLSTSNIKIYDKIFTLSSIKSECRRLKIKEGLDIVIIDYLQLIDSEEKNENRNQDISKITRKLKLIAKELEVTVIALSQLSRAPEVRADHRPMLGDLRESGSIEQDADVVIFLYRDEYYNRNTEDKRIIECIVAKNRNGAVGTARLKWIPEIQKMV